MNKRKFRNKFRLFLTLMCVFTFALPAWASESGPGSDIGVTIVTAAKAAPEAASEDAAPEESAAGDTAPEAGDTSSADAEAGQSRVITCGSGEAAASGGTSEQPEASAEDSVTKGASLGMFTTTGYCTCSQCSGGHSLTYSGTVPKARHTISADLSVFPIGTKVMIGDVVYTVEDMGSSVKGNWIDIYYDSHDAAVAHGMKTEEVFAVES